MKTSNIILLTFCAFLAGLAVGRHTSSTSVVIQAPKERPSQGALQLIREHKLSTTGVALMSSVNKAIVVGNLGADPELRYMPNGTPVCNISVATNEVWKDRATDQKRERVEWHRITLFDTMAENTAKYLKKGSAAYVEGTLRTRKWTDREGIERYTTEILARDIRFLSRPQSEQPKQMAFAEDDDIPF